MKREKVTSVIDGDTFDTATRRVRLAEVNAPEKGRRGYSEATSKLKRLIDGKTVSIGKVLSFSYGRDVCEVKVDNLSVNNEMRKFLGN